MILVGTIQNRVRLDGSLEEGRLSSDFPVSVSLILPDRHASR